MKFVGRIGIVATLAFAASSFAEDSISTGAEVREVIARVEPGSVRPAIVTDAIGLDELAGRYDTPTGALLFVSREGDALTLELPGSPAPTTLVRLDARTFASADDSVIVNFQIDAGGRVNGLVLSTLSAQSPIAAARAALRRGIVTIQDVREDVARL
jgi:hypothetical protein